MGCGLLWGVGKKCHLLFSIQQKNAYTMVVSDHFTEWTESYPNLNHESVAEMLVSAFTCSFTAAHQFHGDQGAMSLQSQ